MKVRGLVTPAVESLYLLLALNTLEGLKRNPLDFYQDVARAAWADDNGTVHIDFDVLGVSQTQRLDFYALDPKKRFKSGRDVVIAETFSALKRTVSVAGLQTENFPSREEISSYITKWMESKLLLFRP